MKKMISMILAIAVVCTAVFLPPGPEGTVQAEEVSFLDDDGMWTAADPYLVDEYFFDSIGEMKEYLGMHLREMFVNRTAPNLIRNDEFETYGVIHYNIHVKTDHIPTPKELNGITIPIQDMIYEHTGNPRGGDYLMEATSVSTPYIMGTIDHEDGTLCDGVWSYGLYVSYTYTRKPKEYNEFWAKLESVMEELDLEGKSDYEKAYAICAWEKSHIVYDKDAPHNQLAYGALVGGRCVCAGFARLFYVMANYAGLDARYDHGGDHAWDVVRIDGTYYYIDPTNFTPNQLGDCFLFGKDIMGSADFPFPSKNTYAEAYSIPERGYFYDHSPCNGQHSFELGICYFPSCEKGGNIYFCTNCPYAYAEDIPATGIHKYMYPVSAEATCTTGASLTHKCMYCGYTYTETVSEPLGHKYVETGCTELSCTDAESVTYTCSVCGDTYTETVAEPLGHRYVETDRTELSCTSAESITYTCSVCGDTYTETVTEASGHHYVKQSGTAPTCVQPGTATYRCMDCGDTYTQTLPATGIHSYEYTVKVAPTCQKYGVAAYICSECGDEQDEIEIIDKEDHKYVETGRTELSCTSAESITYTCSACGDTYTETVTEAPGHDYVRQSGKEPTCVQPGTATYRCSICGDTYTETLPATGIHSYERQVKIEPTCMKPGIAVYICSECGAERDKKEIIDRVDHKYEKLSETAPTGTEPGFIRYQCSECKKKYTEIIPATGKPDAADPDVSDPGTADPDVSDPGIAGPDETDPGVSDPGTAGSGGTDPDVSNPDISGTDPHRLSLKAPVISSLANTSGGITVKWKKAHGAKGYALYRKTQTGKWTLLKRTSAASFTDKKAKNGTTYYYRVKAYRGSCFSPYGSAKKMVRLTMPVMKSAGNTAKKKVTVKWAKNAKASGYQIRYASGTSSRIITVSGKGAASRVVKSLKKGKTYKFYVRSYKTVSKSRYYSAWSKAKKTKIRK